LCCVVLCCVVLCCVVLCCVVLCCVVLCCVVLCCVVLCWCCEAIHYSPSSLQRHRIMASTMVASEQITVVLAHHAHESDVEAAARMLNSQWPRSLSARMAALQKSCDTLPLHLLLINESIAAATTSTDNEAAANQQQSPTAQEQQALRVIGHSALSQVAEDPSGLLIESGSTHTDTQQRDQSMCWIDLQLTNDRHSGSA
jgi:hypothetical protein